MKSIRPMPLQKGDTIGIVSPSSPIGSKSIKSSINFLQEIGFKIKFATHYKNEERFLAGRDIDRSQDIMDFFKDPEIKAIIASRGGQGSQRLLPLLDYSSIIKMPKVIVGFSDTTALQLGIFKKTGLVHTQGSL